MMRSRKLMKTGFVLLSALICSIGICGCSTTLTVYKYPSFFGTPGEYNSMTVQRTVDRNALSHELVTSIASESNAYGGYDFVTRNDEVPTDLSAWPEITDTDDWFTEETLQREVEIEVPDLDEYGDPIYDEDGYLLTHIETEIRDYPWFTRTARVDAAVIVTRNSDNQSIGTYSSYGQCSDSDEFRDNLASYSSLYSCAVSDVGDTLASYITPHWSHVTVKNSDLLVIGYVKDNGRMEEKTRKWKLGESIVFEVWFPNAARMNSFIFDIVTKDSDTVIYSQDIYWEANGALRYTGPVETLVNASGGADTYYARIISNNEVAYADKFTLSLD